MASTVATKRIPEQEWARHESTIRQLYLENDKGLQDVMEHMAGSCGFHASKSQYETRFKKWGIVKNRKRVEWKVVAQHVERRKAAGKKSDVFINGAPVSEARVQREMTRLGYRPSRGLSSSGMEASPPLPPGFRIQTPPPERQARPELPTIQLYLALDMQLSVTLPLERPAYIDPRSMIGLGDLSFESALLPQRSISPHQPSPQYNSKLLDNIVLPESSLLAFLPPALVALRTDLSTNVNQKTTSPFTSLFEPQPLSSPYARLLIFQLINGFIHRSGLTPVDVWNFLKANAGQSLRTFFQRLPQQEAKFLAEKAFQCAIEAGDADGVGFFLDAPDINIQVNDLICERPDGARYTALQLAVRFRHVSVARILLQYGADPNRSHYNTYSHIGALGPASSRDFDVVVDSPIRLELVDLLLENGAIVGDDHFQYATTSKDQELFDRLFGACSPSERMEWARRGHVRHALEFYDQDSAVRLFDELDLPNVLQTLKSDMMFDFQFLNAVAEAGNVTIARRLVEEHGFEIRPQTLVFAAKSGQPNMVRWLLEQLGNSNTIVTMASHAYSAGIESQNDIILEILEEYGALRHIMTEENDSHLALKAAFSVNNFELAKRLLDLQLPRTAEILGDGLFKAIKLVDCELARWLLNLGADPNHVEMNENGTFSEVTTLSVALQTRNTDLVGMLLGSPDIDVSTPPFTPLIRAVEWGDAAVVTDLILAGSPINAPTALFTPLIVAVLKRDRPMIDTLLQFGASVNLSVRLIPDSSNPFLPSHWIDESAYPKKKLMTPLAAAVITGDTENILYLLSNGADPADSTALMEACLGSNEGAIDVILDACRKRYPKGKAGFGYQVMRRAIQQGDLALVRKLLHHNVRFLTLSSLRDELAHDTIYDYRTPLVDAIERTDELGFAIFRMMLDADRDNPPNLDAIIWQNKALWSGQSLVTKSETALLAAIRVQQLDKVRFLVERGADINSPTVRGVSRTPLQAAAETGDYKIVEFLIHSGAKVNTPPAGVRGGTALQFACEYGYAGIVDLLLRSGADVNALPARWSGSTALEAAAEFGRFDIVTMLLDAGAKIEGNFRQYLVQAVDRARKRGHLVMADLLTSRDPILRQERRAITGSVQEDMMVVGTGVDYRFQEDEFIDWSGAIL
ncbi:hypothetical protein NM208_g4443 [Fusarium decemcellulare]|uniref:Uncharacterized protein n=1 Tax=Fusarium decemcellulare TaxID=57161 RepID=A0ACC1SKS4_9HYPO|nr:hypothetical protein NM208_g4443 [Fusarium decemcellulare]